MRQTHELTANVDEDEINAGLDRHLLRFGVSDNKSPRSDDNAIVDYLVDEGLKQRLIKLREEMGEEAFRDHPGAKLLEALLRPEILIGEMRARLKKGNAKQGNSNNDEKS
jgi:hypothetical protein